MQLKAGCCQGAVGQILSPRGKFPGLCIRVLQAAPLGTLLLGEPDPALGSCGGTAVGSPAQGTCGSALAPLGTARAELGKAQGAGCLVTHCSLKGDIPNESSYGQTTPCVIWDAPHHTRPGASPASQPTHAPGLLLVPRWCCGRWLQAPSAIFMPVPPSKVRNVQPCRQLAQEAPAPGDFGGSWGIPRRLHGASGARSWHMTHRHDPLPNVPGL